MSLPEVIAACSCCCMAPFQEGTVEPKSMPNMTGRPGYRTTEMNGGSSAPYLARTPCIPLFCTSFNRGGSRRAFRLPGAGGDHFHCAVEPSPGHIRCRLNSSNHYTQQKNFFFQYFVRRLKFIRYNVHTRCIVKTSGFTRGICKNRGFCLM